MTTFSFKSIRYAYLSIRSMEQDEDCKTPNIQKFIADRKREVRKWANRPVRHIFCVNEYGYIELYDAPKWCETEQDVKDWFEEDEWMHIYSPYDCTGKQFTQWYKPVYRQGKWMVYHSVGYDI